MTPVGQEWADRAPPTWPLRQPFKDSSRDLLPTPRRHPRRRLPRPRRRRRPRRWPAQRPRPRRRAGRRHHADRPPGRRGCAAFGDDFADASAATLYGGRPRRTTPSRSSPCPAPTRTPSARSAPRSRRAGGAVAGTYEVQKALTAPPEKSLVDTLGSQLMTQLGDGAVSKPTRRPTSGSASCSASPWPAATCPAPTPRRCGRASRGGAADLAPGRRARPGRAGRAGPQHGSGDPVGRRRRARGHGHRRGGRRRHRVRLGIRRPGHAPRRPKTADGAATVDGVDTALGQVTTVLALIRSLTVQGGSFGAAGADGAVPLD